MAEEIGVSVGKVDYCVKALIEVGHGKLNNFTKLKNKSGDVYVLTPAGGGAVFIFWGVSWRSMKF